MFSAFQGPHLTNDDYEDFTNRQTILFKISSLTYPVDLIPLEASTRSNLAAAAAATTYLQQATEEANDQ